MANFPVLFGENKLNKSSISQQVDASFLHPIKTKYGQEPCEPEFTRTQGPFTLTELQVPCNIQCLDVKQIK